MSDRGPKPRIYFSNLYFEELCFAIGYLKSKPGFQNEGRDTMFRHICPSVFVWKLVSRSNDIAR